MWNFNCALISVVATIVLSTAAVAMPPEDAKAWREDLIAYERGLRDGHIDLHHTLPKSKFDAELAQLRENLDVLSEPQVIVRLMKLTKRIEDGHTTFPVWSRNLKRLPLNVIITEQKAIIIGAPKEQHALLGGVIHKIGDTPIKSIVKTLKEVAPFVENKQSERVRIGALISNVELLHWLGLLEQWSAVEVEIELASGEMTTRSFSAFTPDAANELVTEHITYRNTDAFEPIHTFNDQLWFGANNDLNAVYIQFDSYPSFEEMIAFGAKLREFMDEQETQRLIIDLRENGGGNFFVGLVLMADIVPVDTIDWLNGVYVLSGPKTFSAAMSNAAQARDLLNATLVGEDTGARPCGFQDIDMFELPNSKLTVTYSKRRYCFAGNERTSALEPDHFVPVSIEDFRSNRDAAMTYVLEQMRVSNSSE